MLKLPNKSITALPDFYFSDPENYIAFWLALRRYVEGISRRKVGDLIMDTASAMDSLDVKVVLFLAHWHQYGMDPDARAISHILASEDYNADRPLIHSKKFSLLQLLSACIQFEDPAYFQQVSKWCKVQELCLND